MGCTRKSVGVSPSSPSQPARKKREQSQETLLKLSMQFRMARNSTRSGIMMSLTCLLLLLTATVGESTGSFKSITTADVVSKSAKIAPEILNDQKLFTLDSAFNSANETAGLFVKVIGPNNNTRECFLPIIAVPLEIRRLSDKTALMIVVDYDNFESSKLVLVDTNNCNNTRNVYNASLPLADYYVSTSDNISDEKFTLIVRGRKYCNGHDWCRLFFDPQFRKLEPLDFGFPGNASHVSVEPATTFDGSILVARFTDDNNTHHLRSYDLSKNNSSTYEELLTLPTYKSDGTILGKSDPRYIGIVLHELAVSGRSYCWLKHFEVSGYNRVHCTKFRENGNVLFNKTIDYKEPLNYVRLESIPNGLIFFSTSAASCRYYSCDNVRVAVITRGSACVNGASCVESNSIERDVVVDVKRREYDFGCKIFDVRSEMKVRVNESTGGIELEYVCTGNKTFSLNKITVE